MSEWDKPKIHVVNCMCGHDRDHSAVFHLWKDEEYGDEFTISTGLNHYRGFWARLWIGIKYALGIDNTHYFFTEQTLNKEELLKLKEFIDDAVDGYDPVGGQQQNDGPKYELDDGPLTDEQEAQIRELSPDLPDERLTQKLI